MTGLKLDRTEWAVQDISAHVEPELSLGLGAAMNRSRDLPCNLVGASPTWRCGSRSANGETDAGSTLFGFDRIAFVLTLAPNASSVSRNCGVGCVG